MYHQVYHPQTLAETQIAYEEWRASQAMQQRQRLQEETYDHRIFVENTIQRLTSQVDKLRDDISTLEWQKRDQQKQLNNISENLKSLAEELRGMILAQKKEDEKRELSRLDLSQQIMELKEMLLFALSGPEFRQAHSHFQMHLSSSSQDTQPNPSENNTKFE